MSKNHNVSRTRHLTEQDERILEAIIETGSYAKAATKLSMNPNTVRAVVFRIRNRYSRAFNFCEKVRGYQARLSKVARSKRYFVG